MKNETNIGQITMTAKIWGWDMFQLQKIILERNHYYGIRIFMFKIMVWHPSFDPPLFKEAKVIIPRQ